MIKELREVFFPTSCNRCAVETADYLCINCVSALASSVEVFGIRCLTGHNPEVVNLVRNWKEHHNLSIQRIFESLLLEALEKFECHTALTCVPTRTESFRKRGGRPLESLVSSVARKTNRKFYPTALTYTRRVLDQRGLDTQTRHLNLLGAFCAEIKDQNLILIDDVVTSGSTLNAAARELRKFNKVIDILALVSARSVNKSRLINLENPSQKD